MAAQFILSTDCDACGKMFAFREIDIKFLNEDAELLVEALELHQKTCPYFLYENLTEGTMQ